MNTSEIIQSKQQLEEDINALVYKFRERHNLSYVHVNTYVRHFDFGDYMNKTQMKTIVNYGKCIRDKNNCKLFKK